MLHLWRTVIEEGFVVTSVQLLECPVGNSTDEHVIYRFSFAFARCAHDRKAATNPDLHPM
jgi:hypothetical protein